MGNLCRKRGLCLFKAKTIALLTAAALIILCLTSETGVVLRYFEQTQYRLLGDAYGVEINARQTYPVNISALAREFIPSEFSAYDLVNWTFSGEAKQPGPGFYLITMFNLFTGQILLGYDLETMESKVKRNAEYLSAIKQNMDHAMIKRIILLYTQPMSLEVLLGMNWPNITKVYPLRMDHLLRMADFFKVSGRYLLNEPVIASNGDIVVGENFERINITRLRSTKTLFTLTRHGNKGIPGCDMKSMCLMRYAGSHDTHIFSLTGPLPDSALSLLDYPVNLQQAENAMIGVMKQNGFTVSNPCTILTTYHIHCSRIGERLKPEHNSVRHAPYNMPAFYIRVALPVNDLQYGKVVESVQNNS